LRLQKAADYPQVMAKSPLVRSRQLDERTFILEAPDAWTSAREAARLAALPEVEVCTPVFRRPFTLNGPYAARSNDTYMPNQWHLENRDANGNPGGADINVRAAWPLAKGEGVVVAVADEGVELSHPDLAGRTAGTPHKNFHTNAEDGNPMNLDANRHGTAVAGLITGDTDNTVGLAGLAPLAKLASWVIFNGSGAIANDQQLAEMFNYASDKVSVQNHSWGGLANIQVNPSYLEGLMLNDAVTLGRGGHGVVIVRAAGNHRIARGNVNDDGYASVPDAIAVGAVRLDGRAASYGSRGASILVSAPSGDTGFPTLFTTDLTGTKGYNQISFIGDQNNYGFGSAGFTGTSGSTPEISGIVALMLSANPELNLRDVQHILVQSARHIDLADPALQTNGAGFLTSDNVGFGIPDAGVAVKLAQSWSNQPPRSVARTNFAGGVVIPELATRLTISGPNQSPLFTGGIQAYPTDLGPRADLPLPALPMVPVGYATNVIATDLHGKAALIERGPAGTFPDDRNSFANKIKRASEAGAMFVVVYDNVTNSEPLYMSVDAFSPLPAVFIGRVAGLTLSNYLVAEATATVGVSNHQATVSFIVTDEMVCEHVGVKLRAEHPVRADLRITLVSPSGTISTLQAVNNSAGGGPTDWTYYTTQNFYEPSKGRWTIQMTDEIGGDTGLFTEAELIINGIPIVDSDGDGLDDNWETTHFGNLAQGPKDDPDGDGWQNAREQVRGTDPNANDEPFALDVSTWNQNFQRLSWPAKAGVIYEAKKFTGAAFTPTTLTNITGKFPVTELFLPYTNTTSGYIFLQRPAP
jgi:subtilisin family serine protease